MEKEKNIIKVEITDEMRDIAQYGATLLKTDFTEEDLEYLEQQKKKGKNIKYFPAFMVTEDILKRWLKEFPKEEIKWRCYCCDKHITELKPFGGPGDPLLGDFTGALLVKHWRWDYPLTEEFNQTSSSWECRDCIVLPCENKDDDYWKISHEGHLHAKERREREEEEKKKKAFEDQYVDVGNPSYHF